MLLASGRERWVPLLTPRVPRTGPTAKQRPGHSVGGSSEAHADGAERPNRSPRSAGNASRWTGVFLVGRDNGEKGRGASRGVSTAGCRSLAPSKMRQVGTDGDHLIPRLRGRETESNELVDTDGRTVVDGEGARCAVTERPDSGGEGTGERGWNRTLETNIT